MVLGIVPMTITGRQSNMENENKAKKSKTRLVLNIAFFTVLSLMLAVVVITFIDIRSGYRYPIFGLRTSVITSPSMATVNPANESYITSDMKQIQKDDVITTRQYQSFDEIKIYDVATYYSGKSLLICHRVVDKYEENGEKYVVFKGDANSTIDAPVKYSYVRGKVINVVPKAGAFVSFIQSPYFVIGLFGAGFFVALAFFIVDSKKKKAVTEQAELPQEEVPLEEAPKEEDNKE